MLVGRAWAGFPRSGFARCCNYVIEHGFSRTVTSRRALWVAAAQRDAEGKRKIDLGEAGGHPSSPLPLPLTPPTGGEFSVDSVSAYVASLSVDQRAALLAEIHEVQATEVKKKAEEKLASWRWRSRFGRPTSVHSLGADPTGTYCAIPQDWLRQKVAEKAKPKPPTAAELRKLAVFNALPFIGFGFLDNFIMIVAGDYIDITIGTTLGISTLAAAALGNTVSDLAGIGSAWYVENVATRTGIHPPDLSQEQIEMVSSRWSANLGRGIGVVIGCLLGMFPLMFLPFHSEDKNEAKAT